MEFPAVSQSRKEFWSAPQYTRNGMLLFTVFFGFFGLHHLMLRSPQTALLMFFTNVILVGYPWFYDIIQLLPEEWGGHGINNLNTYGMGHAFGTLGLAQGMWLPDDYTPPKKEPEDAPPNPWWFVLFCVTLPFTFLAPLFGGDNFGALAKLGYNFFFFGWFLGMCAFAYDLFYLLLKPADLFAFGLKRFFPWTLFLMDKDGHSPSITGVRPPIPDLCPPAPAADNFFVGTLKFFISLALPIMYVVNPPLAMSLETSISSAASGAGVIGDVAVAVTQSAKQLSNAAITTADIATNTASAVIRDGSKIAGTIGTLAGSLDELGSAALTHQLPLTPLGIPAGLPAGLPAAAALLQKGGGQSFSPLDYAAFGTIAAVIGGAFILAAGRSYGAGEYKGDFPPNA